MEILYERLEINRLQKVLEGANIKLSSVASDILGASARAMLEAIIHGTDDPHLLSQLAKGRMKKKKKELERALRGLVGPIRNCSFQLSYSISIFWTSKSLY